MRLDRILDLIFSKVLGPMMSVLDLHAERGVQLLLHRSLSDRIFGRLQRGGPSSTLVPRICCQRWAGGGSLLLPVLEVLLDGKASASSVAIYIVCGLGWATVVWWYSILIVEMNFADLIWLLLVCRRNPLLSRLDPYLYTFPCKVYLVLQCCV
jgi:hypothetical protein